MTTSNKVKEVFRAMIYEDVSGVEWKRGLDGWFCEMGKDLYVIRHDEMASVIERESIENN